LIEKGYWEIEKEIKSDIHRIGKSKTTTWIVEKMDY